MFVVAAAGFLVRHPTAPAFVGTALVKINTCFFSHAIMDLHGNARGYHEVAKGQYREQELFQRAKLAKSVK
ncbi:MAG: hypothetical protein JWQ27_3204 [Ferruginibacter sp.]|nr:hypothetical protein [Ferruginibacter sp.]